METSPVKLLSMMPVAVFCKTAKKEWHSEAAVLSFDGASSQFTAHLYNERLGQCRTDIQSERVGLQTRIFCLA